MGRGCTRAVDTCDGYITAAHLSRELWLLHRDRLVAEPSEIHRARGSVVNLPKVSGELALGHRDVYVSGPAAVPEARRPRVVHRHRVGPIDPPPGGWHREVSKVPWVCGRASRGCARPATRKRGLTLFCQAAARDWSSGAEIDEVGGKVSSGGAHRPQRTHRRPRFERTAFDTLRPPHRPIRPTRAHPTRRASSPRHQRTKEPEETKNQQQQPRPIDV